MVVTADVNVSQKRERRILGNVALYRFAVEKKKGKRKKKKKKEKEIRDSALRESRCHVRRRRAWNRGEEASGRRKRIGCSVMQPEAVRCYMRV